MSDPLVITGVWCLHDNERRVLNYERFNSRIGAELITVELALDDDPFMLDAWCHHGEIIHLRGTRERHGCLFQKEALENYALRHSGECLNHDVICWIDADVMLINPYWMQRCQRELENASVCQLFSQTRYETDFYELGDAVPGAAYRWSTRQQDFDDYRAVHPGLAWAARGEFIRKRLLYDRMITGGNDHVMWKAWTSMARLRHQDKMSSSFRKSAFTYCSIDDDVQVGFVEGCAIHMHHGDMRARDYETRWYLPWYDPETDVYVDEQGLLAWTDWALKEKREHIDALREVPQGN